MKKLLYAVGAWIFISAGSAIAQKAPAVSPSPPTVSTDPFACRDSSPPAKPEEQPQPSGFFDQLGNCHIFLKSSLFDDQQGASFAYSHDSSQNQGGFKSQFALGYRSGSLTGAPPGPAILVDIDGNVATGTQPTAKNTYLNFRTDLVWRFTSATGGPDELTEGITSVNGLYVRAGPLYEASQDFKIQNLLAEVSATFSRSAGPHALNFGQYTQIGNSGIEVRMRPYLGLQLGGNIRNSVPSPAELDSTRLRIVPQPILEFQLSHPEKIWSGLKSVTWQLVDTLYILPLEGRTQTINGAADKTSVLRNEFSTSLQFGIGSGVSFGPIFSTGATAPTFKPDTSIVLALKIGFGEGGFVVPRTTYPAP